MRRTITQGYFKLMANTKQDGEHWVRKREDRGTRPRVVINNRQYHASRVVMHIHAGLNLDDPDKLVCHACDNPQCYNPTHLYIGDKSTNALDHERSLRGRL